MVDGDAVAEFVVRHVADEQRERNLLCLDAYEGRARNRPGEVEEHGTEAASEVEHARGEGADLHCGPRSDHVVGGEAVPLATLEYRDVSRESVEAHVVVEHASERTDRSGGRSALGVVDLRETVRYSPARMYPLSRTLQRVGLPLVLVASALPFAPASAEATPIPYGYGAPIAIVIDDVVDGRNLEAFLKLDAPITYAIFPFSAGSARASAKVIAAGAEPIIHLPIRERRSRRGGWFLAPGWTQEEMDDWADRAVASVPGAVGANNHMGSTTNVRAMRALMARLVLHGLFFMDSVTVPNTVAYAAALEAGMPSRINNSFLDTTATVKYSRGRILGLARHASKRGTAIGIGHLQRKTTLQALREAIPILIARGYRIVPLSELTNTPNSPRTKTVLPPAPTTTATTTTATTPPTTPTTVS